MAIAKGAYKGPEAGALAWTSRNLGWILWWSLKVVALVVVLLFGIALRLVQISGSTVTGNPARTRSEPERRSSATKRKARSR